MLFSFSDTMAASASCCSRSGCSVSVCRSSGWFSNLRRKVSNFFNCSSRMRQFLAVYSDCFAFLAFIQTQGNPGIFQILCRQQLIRSDNRFAGSHRSSPAFDLFQFIVSPAAAAAHPDQALQQLIDVFPHNPALRLKAVQRPAPAAFFFP